MKRLAPILVALACAIAADAQSVPARIVVDGHALSGVVTIPAMSGNSVFAGAAGTVFVANLVGDTAVTTTNIAPGQIYVFELVEPTTAPAFTVAFPAATTYNCDMPLDMNLGATTVYVAVGLADGALMCLNAMSLHPQPPI